MITATLILVNNSVLIKSGKRVEKKSNNVKALNFLTYHIVVMTIEFEQIHLTLEKYLQ